MGAFIRDVAWVLPAVQDRSYTNIWQVIQAITLHVDRLEDTSNSANGKYSVREGMNRAASTAL